MKKLIGTKDFYKRVIAIAIPIMLHQGISSFVNLLDNIMIGNYSNQAMAGVSVTNQIFFCYRDSYNWIFSNGWCIFIPVLWC